MKKTLAAAVIGLTLGACAGSSNVVTVDGVRFDLDDVPIETDASSIDPSIFRNALNWMIANEVVMKAAEAEFGIRLSEQEVLNAAQLMLPLSDADDPRVNLDFLRIQARIGLEGLLWPELEPRLPEGISFVQWFNDRLSAADVEVGVRFGEWRVSPGPGVYEP